MTEIATFRKNKIELTEYDYEKDVHNRVLMASFSPKDIEVLEEILFSSLRIPLTVLEQNLDIESDLLLSILDKLSQTGLFKVISDHVIVDKELRKYYEFQCLKFEEDFKPGMEYLQGLLRKVPIHVLPNWYSISRTSNNIFESIVEKYLATPQIFQRYIMDLHLSEPIQKQIMTEVYASPNYEVDAEEIMKKYSLSQREFEEHMLFLEFSFVCCVQFKKQEGKFKPFITPFQEWKEYLTRVQKGTPVPIADVENIQKEQESDFAIVEEISKLLTLAKKSPLTRSDLASYHWDNDTISYYFQKLATLNLATIENGKLACTSDSVEWLKMDLLDRALYLYRHPLNYLDDRTLPNWLCEHRILREAEKSLTRIANFGWIYLDDFVKSLTTPLKEEQEIQLVRLGRNWEYQFPEYSDEEISFFKAFIQNWLFELGLTAIGTKNGKDCFTLTPLGRDLFSHE